MLKFGGFGTVLILIFAVWCLMGANRSMQMERACRPVGWFGNVTVSIVAVTAGSWVKSVAHSFDKVDYTCQYALWRLFYERAWQQAIQDGKIDPVTQLPPVREGPERGQRPRRLSTPDRGGWFDAPDGPKPPPSREDFNPRLDGGEQFDRPIPYPLPRSM